MIRARPANRLQCGQPRNCEQSVDKIQGAIRPKGTGKFDRETWCEFVAQRPEFRFPEPREVRNPFTGKSMTVRRNPADPDVVIDGRTLGIASWSMSEEPLVNVSVEPTAIPLVLEWANELSGEFQEEHCDSD
jgi:hypothetical protein